MDYTLLSAQNVTKYYPLKSRGFSRRTGEVKAVDDVSFDVQAKEVFGLVGESGCGKSTLGRVLLRLEDPTGGNILFQQQDIAAFPKLRLTQFRKEAQIIYQDPYSALNPRKKIGQLVREPLDIHRIGTLKDRQERVAWLLETVGLLPDSMNRYPHQFSGGQRQRIVIARALALNPQLLLADEPVSALDVSIQAQVINLLMDLREEFGLTYIFISHDLSVVEHLCDRVAVMYLGRIVELAPKKPFYVNPKHPYSQALLSAAPTPNPEAPKRKILLQGDVPSPVNPPRGCPFHPRCPIRQAEWNECLNERPILREIAPGWKAACHVVS